MIDCWLALFVFDCLLHCVRYCHSALFVCFDYREGTAAVAAFACCVFYCALACWLGHYVCLFAALLVVCLFFACVLSVCFDYQEGTGAVAAFARACVYSLLAC